MLEKSYLLFGACNPMIDITASVTKDFLRKFNLKPNDAIIGDDNQTNIYDEMKSKFPETLTYTAGGSGYNTLRTSSWILGKLDINIFMGCVGKDEYASIVKSKAKESGLKTIFQTTNQASTATCATLLTDKNRSMVAHLGAACKFTEDHLDCPDNWAYIENSQVFYITGFFLATCMNAVTRIAIFCHENDRLFCFNLSALFLIEFYKKELLIILPYVDILFGNEDEAILFAKNILNIQTSDIRKITKHISGMHKKNNRKRLVVITRADKSVIYTNKKVNEMKIPKIESRKIIDTSCAGDAFCGGFLAQLVKNESIDKCIDCGIWASGIIIQRSGCEFPAYLTYQQNEF